MVVVGVTRVTSYMVKPTIPPPYRFSTLPSSKLDLVIANIYVRIVYFFKHHGSSSCLDDDFFNRPLLIQALSQALSLFYPFAGTITPEIDIACNGKGALFVDALADCSIEALGDLTPHPELLQLVPTLDESQDITSHPLLLIQVSSLSNFSHFQFCLSTPSSHISPCHA